MVNLKAYQSLVAIYSTDLSKAYILKIISYIKVTIEDLIEFEIVGKKMFGILCKNYKQNAWTGIALKK